MAQRIAKLNERAIAWVELNTCDGEITGNDDPDVCDISEMNFEEGELFSRNCSALFICGSITLKNVELNLVVEDNIYIDAASTFTVEAPPKAAKGQDMDKEVDGEPGLTGKVVMVAMEEIQGLSQYLSRVLLPLRIRLVERVD